MKERFLRPELTPNAKACLRRRWNGGCVRVHGGLIRLLLNGVQSGPILLRSHHSRRLKEALVNIICGTTPAKARGTTPQHSTAETPYVLNLILISIKDLVDGDKQIPGHNSFVSHPIDLEHASSYRWDPRMEFDLLQFFCLTAVARLLKVLR